jgi:hypothetical protein
MPNTFEYADWLAMECLDLLENKRAISQFFNTDYSADFKLKYPVGESIRVPFPQRFTVVRGLPYQPQAINRLHANINFIDPFQIGFDWDSAEQALKAPRGREKVSKEILEPAMAYARQAIDDVCAQYAYQNAASLVGILGTDPTTFDAFSAAARQKMDELGCPSGDRAFCIPPAVNRALKSSSVTYFNPITTLAKQWRTGLIGEADGFEFYNTMSLYRHTAGTWAGAVTVTSTVTTEGTTSLGITCTNGDTFKAGDKISILNVLPTNPMTRRTFGTTAKTFTITADVTASGTTATLVLSPPMYGPTSQYCNVNALPVASAALTLWPGTTSPSGKSGTVSLAIQRNAFALVGVELEEPKSGSVELVSQKRDPDSGMTIRFIREWDGELSRFINRFDWMIGLGTFYNDACAVACAGA